MYVCAYTVNNALNYHFIIVFLSRLIYQLTTKAVVKENSRNRTPQFVCDYFTEEQSTITIHTPELDVPFPLKKMSNRPDPPPLSMRAILSEIQSNEGNHKTAAASLSENGTLGNVKSVDSGLLSTIS